jgi:Rod binding domain-containing protein
MELKGIERGAGRTDLGSAGNVRDVAGAAREFEAMLIGELLNTAFSPESVSMGGEADSSSSTMLEFGREHLSRMIATGGGFGLAKLVESGLTSGAIKR